MVEKFKQQSYGKLRRNCIATKELFEVGFILMD
jgi:hypothetical protein